MILAIDPGPEQSAWVRMRRLPTNRKIPNLSGGMDGWGDFGIEPTASVCGLIKNCWRRWHVVCEDVKLYGVGPSKPVVAESTIETAKVIGEYRRVVLDHCGGSAFWLLDRRAIKLHICGTVAAKDSHIRQALIDRFGPGREKAIGRKANPGPLYGFKSHLWSALAVGVTYYDRLNGGVS